MPSPESLSAALSATLSDHLAASRASTPGAMLRELVDAGLDRLPLPGQGATLDRWRALAAAGRHDLSVAKLYEGHTDALAILHEARAGAAPAGSVWATWCAEPPDARVALRPDADGGVTLHGRKAWCSGAHDVTHAVVSCWNEAGEPMLAAVDLRQDGVAVGEDGWDAVGMRATRSVDVHFDGARAQALGGPGFYVRRAGFWHGGAGVAACWFGAATALADALRARLARAQPGPAARDDAHRLAQLGRVTVLLDGCAALMRRTAACIDREPHADAMAAALALRLQVDAAATATLAAVGRALGPGPMCKDAALARLFADLPVFLRQGHAERDEEALGRIVAAGKEAPWRL